MYLESNRAFISDGHTVIVLTDEQESALASLLSYVLDIPVGQPIIGNQYIPRNYHKSLHNLYNQTFGGN